MNACADSQSQSPAGRSGRVVLVMARPDVFAGTGEVARLLLLPEGVKWNDAASSDEPALVVCRDARTGVFRLDDSPVPLHAAVRARLEAAWRCGCAVEVWDELGEPLLAGPLVPVQGGLARWVAHYSLLVSDPGSGFSRQPP